MMNSGKWDYDRWGHPGEPGVGSGAELWAWMGDGARTRYCPFLPSPLFSLKILPTSPQPPTNETDDSRAKKKKKVWTSDGKRCKTRFRACSARRLGAWTPYTRPPLHAPSRRPATSHDSSPHHTRARTRMCCATRRCPPSASARKTSRRSSNSSRAPPARASLRCSSRIRSSMLIGTASACMSGGALAPVSSSCCRCRQCLIRCGSPLSVGAVSVFSCDVHYLRRRTDW
jgi:hypothetical protein